MFLTLKFWRNFCLKIVPKVWGWRARQRPWSCDFVRNEQKRTAGEEMFFAANIFLRQWVYDIVSKKGSSEKIWRTPYNHYDENGQIQEPFCKRKKNFWSFKSLGVLLNLLLKHRFWESLFGTFCTIKSFWYYISIWTYNRSLSLFGVKHPK